jgi:hypothetical protein
MEEDESCQYLRCEEEAAERVEGRAPRDPAAEEVVDGHVGAGGGEGGGLGVVPWSACWGKWTTENIFLHVLSF